MSEESAEESPSQGRARRRIRRLMVVSSGSDTDSDESVVVSARRKRLRVISDGEAESSSSSAIPIGRRRGLPKIPDSEDSDTSGWATDRSDVPKETPVKPTSGFTSDSSEGNSDKCSICLLRFTDQPVGTPQVCEHIFCLDCITEWSKNVNTCPVDRMTFEAIVVRSCAGGHVLRTEPVKVTERRPSVDDLVTEDPTQCEVCGSTDNEETMLLCDVCDHGFHMHCLTPPLTQVPADLWLCPNCSDQFSDLRLSEMDEPFSGMVGGGASERTRRVSRADEPSTSSGRRATVDPAPQASRMSRGSRAPRSTRTHRHTVRRAAGPRRKRSRRTARTLEYEPQDDGKRKIVERVRRRIRRRKVRRRPRTAARRSHVRASVRAQLAALRGNPVAELPLLRSRAGAPALSLFGNAHQLEYFSDGGDADAPGPTAVASRPTAAMLSAFRQARRKMITIPSPPHATVAPDLLSDILESQTRLHSKNSMVSVAVDGHVEIKLAGDGRVRLGTGVEGARQAPSYPGQSRGGGWGGGYRGTYHREQTAGYRGGGDAYGGGYRPRPPEPYRGGPHRDDQNSYYPRPHRRTCPDDVQFERPRRPDVRPPPPRVSAWPPCPGAAPAPADRAPEPQRYGPLPEPPAFKFDREADKSEDEGCEAGLVIDTEKYDPTEPTDDDSGSEAALPAASSPAVRSIMAGIDVPNVPPEVLDNAVRQVLREHREARASAGSDGDGDSDGDCPNFSIYSATSVHIASGGGGPTDSPPPAPRDDLEDLVQEDDEPAPPAPPTPPPLPPAPAPAPAPLDGGRRRAEDEYKEKISRRCPITTNTRNPIKIKLNTPSLIRRQVSLYDEEDLPADAEPELEPEAEAEVEAEPEAEPDAAEAEAETAPRTPPLDEAEKEEREPTVESDPGVGESKDEEAKDEERQKSPEIENDIPKSDDENPEDRLTRSPPIAGAQKETPSPREGPLEKMTESISETEDERSYTPCLDENVEHPDRPEAPTPTPTPDRAAGLEGLDTEMISEDEGNGLFSEEEGALAPLAPRTRSPSPSRSRSRTRSPSPSPSPSRSRSRSPPLPGPAPPGEDGEIVDGAPEGRRDEARKKRKKDTKREAKEGRAKGSRPDVAFKKLAKGKGRNYRDRDREGARRAARDARDSSDDRRRRRKEKRKDLERYDVRTVVTEKRRRPKDAFGRDVSPRRSASPSPRSASPSPPPRAPTPLSVSRPSPPRKRRRSPSARKSPRRRRSASRIRKRRRSASPRKPKKKKRPRPERSPRRKSPKRRRAKRRGASPGPALALPSPKPPGPGEGGASARAWSRPPSPRTPPPEPAPPPRPERRRREERHRRRMRELAGPSKEVFTSGDNILVSVSFKDQERDEVEERRRRREARRERRRLRRTVAPNDAPKPVAIIDLERSPFRELTPSPKNVIVLSDSEGGEREATAPPESVAPAEVAPEPAGPKTPPEPSEKAGKAGPAEVGAAAALEPAGAEAEGRGPATPPDSPDAYDPFEPTRSPSPAGCAVADSPPRPSMTLEAAQKTNMSADEVIDRRPLSPMEKVMALLQSTRDVSPEPPPGETLTSGLSPGGAGAPMAPVVGAPPPALNGIPAAAAPTPLPPGPLCAGAGSQVATRIVLPEAARAQPKLFLAKPSPIKSNPIKPMQATKISRLPLPRRRSPVADSPEGADSPYSPASSDFGSLFSPPGGGGGGGGGPAKRDSFDALFDKPRARASRSAAKVPVKLNKKKGNKTQVGVKIDEENLKILDDLPSSAVAMQVKNKFLKKLNRQERVVEEVKLVLKPHYNKKHVTKDEYKDILRRAVPKICHNKSGEINPTKIQALVEAYVKKFRKKHKLGIA